MFRKHLKFSPPLRLLGRRLRFLFRQRKSAESALVFIVDGAAQGGGLGEGEVGTQVGGGIGGDVEEGGFVEDVDFFEGGWDREIFGVFFGVEEVRLVGVGVVEEGDLEGVSDGRWCGVGVAVLPHSLELCRV